MLIHAFQGHQNSLSSSQLCGSPLMWSRQVVKSQIKCRKYTPSFEQVPYFGSHHFAPALIVFILKLKSKNRDIRSLKERD